MSELPVGNNASKIEEDKKKSMSIGRKVMAGIAAATALFAGGKAITNDSTPVNPNKVDATLDQDATTPETTTTTAPVPEAPTTTAPAEVTPPLPVIDPALEPGPHTSVPGERPGGSVAIENPNVSPEAGQPTSEQIGQAANQLATAFESLYNEGIGDGNAQETDPATGNVTTTVRNTAHGGPEGVRVGTYTKNKDGQLVSSSYSVVYGLNAGADPANTNITSFNLGEVNTVSQANFGHPAQTTSQDLTYLAEVAPHLLRDGAPLDAR